VTKKRGVAVISIRTGKSVGLLAALAICAAASSAAAQVHEKGPYIGAGVGINFQEDNNVPVSGVNRSASYNPGPVGIASFGYAFGNSLRLELEPGLRYNDLDTVNGATAHGHTNIFSTMLNGVWDFENVSTPVLPLVPHVGLGVGWAHIRDSGTFGGGTLLGHTDAFAYQVIAGAEYAFTPALKIGLDYRYFTGQDATYRNGSVITKVGDYDEHAILFTVRYSFGSPAPAPIAQVPPAQPAPPPAAAARNYTVYFDFDRSDITPDAKPILQRAASDAKAGNTTRISVTGHTDRSGPDSYNQKLSERRAASVKAELIRDGVPANEIVTIGKGESDPAVPTPDGVREPRNRRVVIVLE
jgi:OOP family OmpA-OmpF porin